MGRPAACAYRLVAEGRDLYWWRHLVSGDAETAHQAGVSVRGRDTVCETLVPDEHIVSWPGHVPKQARKAKRR
jgi:uncharacterized cysteine cluster protein YcgN (CxxCxxCC family)